MGFWKTFTDGYSWRLYERAYGRIWSGKFIFVWWAITWCLAAAYFGFWLFDFIPERVEHIAWTIGMYGFLGITPVIIGWGLVRSYVNEGTGDSFLKTVPLRPHQALMPRMIAVILVWIEFTLPFVVLYWLLMHASMSLLANLFPANISAYTSIKLPDFQVADILRLILPSIKFGDIDTYTIDVITASQLPILYTLLSFEVLGFGLLPIAWGFWWGTIFKRRGGPFILMYFSYIAFPIFLYFLVRIDLIGWMVGYPASVWPAILTVSLSWIVLAVLFTFLTFREWTRRPD